MGYLNLAGQPKAGHYFSLACALIGAAALFAVDCFDDGRKGGGGGKGQQQNGQGGQGGDPCCNTGRNSNGGGPENHLLSDLGSDAGLPGGRQSAGSVGGTVFGGGAGAGAAAAGLWLQQQQGIHQHRLAMCTCSIGSSLAPSAPNADVIKTLNLMEPGTGLGIVGGIQARRKIHFIQA